MLNFANKDTINNCFHVEAKYAEWRCIFLKYAGKINRFGAELCNSFGTDHCFLSTV